MRKYILQQLRERSCIRGKQKTWISDLTDDQLYGLFLMLRNGENAKSVARFTQNTWRVNIDSSVHSISQGVLKFKKRIAHILLSPTSEERNFCPGDLGEWPDSENSLESLDYIASLHRKRIKTMLEEEKRTGVKYPFLNRDLQALAALEKVIIKQKTFEMAYDDPAKRERFERFKKKAGERFDTLMDQLGEDGRMKMANAIGKFLEYAEAHSIPMERGPDGTLLLIEPEK
jgi:hypothetical protein